MKKMSDIFPTGEMAVINRAFEAMDWAEEEIEAAQVRHHETGRGPIWRRGFLAVRQWDLADSELLFRAHCREILDRIASGEDIRPGTDAEMIKTLRDASLRAPMQPGIDCLYFRLFARAFPEYAPEILGPTDLAAYENVHGSAADDHEARLRSQLNRVRGE